MAKAREKLIKDGGPTVKILNFLYPGKGSRFKLDDEKREFDYEKKQDTKKDKKKVSKDEIGVPSKVDSEATLSESLEISITGHVLQLEQNVI